MEGWKDNFRFSLILSVSYNNSRGSYNRRKLLLFFKRFCVPLPAKRRENEENTDHQEQERSALSKAELPAGYEVQANVASNTTVKVY